jgi:Skp family chaperone for outer membrane proteins
VHVDVRHGRNANVTRFVSTSRCVLNHPRATFNGTTPRTMSLSLKVQPKYQSTKSKHGKKNKGMDKKIRKEKERSDVPDPSFIRMVVSA